MKNPPEVSSYPGDKKTKVFFLNVNTNMDNIFQTAKTIREKREILKGISKSLQELKKDGTIESVNKGLKILYAQQGHTQLKTLHQWNKDGYRVKSGERALCLWGTPREYERNKSEEDTEKNDPTDFYPLCYVFSNLQIRKS